ncbi:MAG: N-acetylmuramoyl-L-alanine amidase [Treponema sp.]|nr:N-acetylmuramoyl-L-alanine amidase [Treponema sp.]
MMFPHSSFRIPHYLSALSLEETIKTLSSVSQNDRIQFRWDPLFRNGIFYSGNHNGAFSVAAQDGQTGFLLVNNTEVFNVPLPFNNKGSLDFPEDFVNTLKNTFTRLHENDASLFRVASIIIDPGHGGRDSGTIGYISENGRQISVYEKDIVLKVALSLRNRLIQTFPDKQILMTRDNDSYLSLDQRSDMANAVTVRENEAVIFISIHANWGASPNARGYEVWHIKSNTRRTLIKPSEHEFSTDITAILNAMLEEEFTTESILLADSILAGFKKTFGTLMPSRGSKENDWFVVRNSRMPAVLVELGFVSNKQDMEIMSSQEGLRKLTDSLYNGITNFIGIFERK